MDLSSLPECLRPKLRLFLSVDLVGSTIAKQAGNFGSGKSSDFTPFSAGWFDLITVFYREIERRFSKAWETYRTVVAQTYGWPTGRAPELWKTNGDELLYTKEISEPEEVFACVMCWIEAVTDYRVDLRKSHPNLDVKSSVWTAGFPIHNAEVVFFRSVGEESEFLDTGEPRLSHQMLLDQWYSQPSMRETLSKDYIGPSIDVGFRLGACATPRKCMISLEAALMLSSVIPPYDAFKPMQICYDGRNELKGVLGGAPYPMFWIDMLPLDPVLQKEDALCGPKYQDRENVRSFCEAFIKAHPQHLFRPFIVGTGKHSFTEIPPEYTDLILERLNNWNDERQKLETEKESLSADPQNEMTTGETASPAAIEALSAKLGDIAKDPT